MKNCVECGKELGDEANYCGGCGERQVGKIGEPKAARDKERIEIYTRMAAILRHITKP